MGVGAGDEVGAAQENSREGGRRRAVRDDDEQADRMTVTYVVTFEFDTRPPLTHRGTVAASSAATCVSRAVKVAQRTLRPVNWRSVVCVLLERLGEAPEADQLPAEVEAIAAQFAMPVAAPARRQVG